MDLKTAFALAAAVLMVSVAVSVPLIEGERLSDPSPSAVTGPAPRTEASCDDTDSPQESAFADAYIDPLGSTPLNIAAKWTYDALVCDGNTVVIGTVNTGGRLIHGYAVPGDEYSQPDENGTIWLTCAFVSPETFGDGDVCNHEFVPSSEADLVEGYRLVVDSLISLDAPVQFIADGKYTKASVTDGRIETHCVEVGTDETVLNTLFDYTLSERGLYSFDDYEYVVPPVGGYSGASASPCYREVSTTEIAREVCAAYEAQNRSYLKEDVTTTYRLCLDAVIQYMCLNQKALFCGIPCTEIAAAMQNLSEGEVLRYADGDFDVCKALEQPPSDLMRFLTGVICGLAVIVSTAAMIAITVATAGTGTITLAAVGGSMLCGMVAGAASEVMDQVLIQNHSRIDWTKVAVSAVIGGVASGFIGKGAFAAGIVSAGLLSGVFALMNGAEIGDALLASVISAGLCTMFAGTIGGVAKVLGKAAAGITKIAKGEKPVVRAADGSPVDVQGFEPSPRTYEMKKTINDARRIADAKSDGWEAEFVSGTGDEVSTTVYRNGDVVLTRTATADGKIRIGITGEFKLGGKGSEGLSTECADTTVLLPDQKSADMFREYYSKGAKDLYLDLDSASPTIVMRGDVHELGMSLDHVSIFLKNGDRHLHYRTPGSPVDDYDILYHANGHAYERRAAPSGEAMDGKDVYDIHWKETTPDGVNEGDFKAVWNGKWVPLSKINGN